MSEHEKELRAQLIKLEDLLANGKNMNKRFRTEILDGINFLQKELICL